LDSIQWTEDQNQDRYPDLIDRITSSTDLSEWGLHGDEIGTDFLQDTPRKIPDQLIAVKEFWPLENNPIPAGTYCYPIKSALGPQFFYWCPYGTIPGCTEEHNEILIGGLWKQVTW